MAEFGAIDVALAAVFILLVIALAKRPEAAPQEPEQHEHVSGEIL